MLLYSDIWWEYLVFFWDWKFLFIICFFIFFWEVIFWINCCFFLFGDDKFRERLFLLVWVGVCFFFLLVVELFLEILLKIIDLNMVFIGLSVLFILFWGWMDIFVLLVFGVLMFFVFFLVLFVVFLLWFLLFLWKKKWIFWVSCLSFLVFMVLSDLGIYK